MDTSPQGTERRECPICGSVVANGDSSCETCGSDLVSTPLENIRSLNYLLDELAVWEERGIVPPETVSQLRESYSLRLEKLRATAVIPSSSDSSETQSTILSRFRRDRASRSEQSTDRPQRRSFFSTLADPRTIHLLLFIGAAMLVVGVVIWLRDVLYLKLQEPVVQAWLLAIGTVVFTVAGWLIFLRTRLKLSGRALTLIGSLLVPINFWFLVRSGLIDESGRAWLVCAICAALYAMTARVLHDRLYVYLGCIAAVATMWAFIYSIERQAFGPYVLSMMASSVVFLNLAGFVCPGENGTTATRQRGSLSATRNHTSSFWGPPLVHVALAGASLSALSYMPLRLMSSRTFDDGFFRLRTSDYDPGVALVLFMLGGFVAWFTGRRFYPRRRSLLYTVTALALFWVEFLIFDGLNVAGPLQMLVLAASALGAMLAAQALHRGSVSISLRRASLIVSVVLAALLYPVLSASGPHPLTHGLILVLLATTYASSGEPHFREDRGPSATSHALAAFASACLLIFQAINYLQAGDPALVTPFITLGTFGILLLGVSLGKRSRVHSFRVGIYSVVLAFVLACLQNGLDPLGDVETYTTPVAVLLLAAAYLTTRRGQEEYAADNQVLIWTGSLLLCVPLLVHALQYRLLLDVPAPWRDLTALCASLALILYGAAGRLRAPVIAGSISMGLELVALTMTSVHWLQIPLKVYLITAGSVILIVWGLLEFRHEQILRVRRRLNESREHVRERFENLR